MHHYSSLFELVMLLIEQKSVIVTKNFQLLLIIVNLHNIGYINLIIILLNKHLFIIVMYLVMITGLTMD